MKIEGGRLILRSLKASDNPLITKWINQPEIAYFLGISTPISAAQQKRWFKSALADESKMIFAITLRRSGRHIGNIALQQISTRDRNAALNIFIGDPSDRRKGYAEEAMLLLLGYCFNKLGMHRVWLTLHSENKAALRLYESCGMKREGLLREHEHYSGNYVDKIIMGILESEFTNKKTKQRRQIS